MGPFIGRKEELRLLNGVYDKQSASLIVIKGRRRIGKSRLVQEFAKGTEFYSFTGLPPTKDTTAESQRIVFAQQLQKAFKLKKIESSDWWDLLWLLAKKTKSGKIVILFDEISWMGSKDPDFLGKLKTVWDDFFKKNTKLVLVLCSSISSWIEKNIISSTGFMGRVSLTLTLETLPLYESNEFWGSHKDKISSFEKFKFLAVTGGVPRYLEEMHPHLPAEVNIRQLCFEKSGILFNEFDHIFSDLFSSLSTTYKKIIICLADRHANRKNILHALDLKAGGVMGKYLKDLMAAGFVARDFSWNIADGKTSKLSDFRLSDNYLRFYVKYILPNKRKIEANNFQGKALNTFPDFSAMMGLQFENLVLSNRRSIHRLLGIQSTDIISDGAYFQHKTARKPGCQIDYLIQTHFDSLYVCEIKFSKNKIGLDVIDEVKKKISALKRPKYFSCRSVLIHVNGCSEELEDSDFFAHVIDFKQFFETP